jgi:hypothetical protein
VNLYVSAAHETIVRWREAAAERGVSLSVLAAEALERLVAEPSAELEARSPETSEGLRDSPLAQALAKTLYRLLPTNRKPRLSGAFFGADDGTRTHDLLHGKQTL